MIEKLTEISILGWDYDHNILCTVGKRPPTNREIMDKINEIIDKVNELLEIAERKENNDVCKTDTKQI